MNDLSTRIARNIRDLRERRGLTQATIARACGLPRATWTNLESGSANPTLQVLHRVAEALSVSIEELLSVPRAACQFYPKGTLPQRDRTGVAIAKLLPDNIPGMEIERLELPPGRKMTGVPHTPGTREYLICEAGVIILRAAGEEWRLKMGDVVAFRGDQPHIYENPTARVAVGYSVVVLARVT
jgi:transcriptional regulator with XRE-family HTH domain